MRTQKQCTIDILTKIDCIRQLEIYRCQTNTKQSQKNKIKYNRLAEPRWNVAAHELSNSKTHSAQHKSHTNYITDPLFSHLDEMKQFFFFLFICSLYDRFIFISFSKLKTGLSGHCRRTIEIKSHQKRRSATADSRYISMKAQFKISTVMNTHLFLSKSKIWARTVGTRRVFWEHELLVQATSGISLNNFRSLALDGVATRVCHAICQYEQTK